MKSILFLLLIPLQLLAQKFTPTEMNRWQQQAQQVSITRDQYGIPHVYGTTDADAVFGLLYAQCEDDFKRVEMNYIEKLGRLAEVKGEAELYNDLLIRLLIDSTEAISDYQKAEPWLKKLLNAYADGINYYLYQNPEVKPALLHRFKPWYPLLWTDGSIGAINTADITVTELKNFYTGSQDFSSAVPKKMELPSGSNGFAFAPAKTESGHAILYINPHVTFYFRPEVQVQSQEGLNAYGAVTWGQFFVYQGFNEHCGWMHTSGNTDVADLYEEKIVKKNKALFYQYNNSLKPVTQKKITLRYREGEALKTKIIQAYYTHHGPIMAQRHNKWISLKSYNRSMVSLVQSWQRTKAKSFAEYKKVMDLKANTSNNTVYADAEGNIAYWHGNYVPVRDKALDWSKPVDGSLAATEYKGLHPVDETVHLYNPANGWIQNCNSTPFTAAGPSSPKKANYPAYMAPDGENFRGVNAVHIFSNSGKYTLDKVIADAYNTHLAAFDVLLPALSQAYEANKTATPYQPLAETIKLLAAWDRNSSESSVATTLAIEWAQKLSPAIRQVYIDQGDADQVQKTQQFAQIATADQLLAPLLEVKAELQSKFGKWNIAWGEINRYQRLSGDLELKYDDTQPSLPSGFAASTWGCLPSFVSRTYPGTNKRYGYNGNSFVCAVEFGPKVRAKSLLAGGNSGNPHSKHFNDQAQMYTQGQFKEVLFYQEDVEKNAEKTYHPGE
ncbi:penicillin acylase family protein [Adhaeribacter pallidiroseus]|uniref:Acyl-homoserine-lactone acylase n=1 Tax=Adhaeribacter pallidiroseus TaxID=2072847 RepID=A0A369QDW0_9BACT|nr:penicillin acylase family protein [Adhaeribacter pallidiroseus]RDC62500.1 Acyl-homoserine-lactone acylase [Adhaeribacter pallidiroseus]